MIGSSGPLLRRLPGRWHDRAEATQLNAEIDRPSGRGVRSNPPDWFDLHATNRAALETRAPHPREIRRGAGRVVAGRPQAVRSDGAADEWDARTYQRVSEPQLGWGRRVVERIPLDGDERAIDGGCGTGRVTRLLAERLPSGSVLAVDLSARMVEEATRQLADLGERVAVRRSDLLDLEVDEPADLVVSTATFHWILDHERLFARLHDALRPGGRLVAQCGGAGNISRTLVAAREVSSLPPYSEALSGMAESWLFAGPEETVTRLEGAGLTGARAWLEEAPARFPGVDAGAEFLATVVLRHHLDLLDEDLRAPFAREVATRCVRAGGGVEIDYVRLNIEARRPGPDR